jgi:hypothetical protein
MLAACDCFYLAPGLARHPRVVVDFEHPKNGQHAEACLRIVCFGELRILSKQSNLAWD